MFPRLAPIFTALLLWATPVHSAGILSDYTMTSWTEDGGLPTVRVMSLAQDLDGYIWIGTAAGLVRFDGVRFVSVATTEGYVNAGRVIGALVSTRDGNIWAGFADVRGVARINRGKTTLYHDAEGEELGFISLLHEDSRGTLWAAGPWGLFRLRGNSWQPVGGATEPFPRSTILGMSNDVNGDVCIVTTEGIFQSDIDGLRQASRDACLELRPVKGASAVAKELSSVLASPFSLLHDRRGNTWLGTRGRGLWRRSSDSGAVGTRLQQPRRLSSDAVWSVLEDREGNIWVGTLAGLHKLTPRKFESVRTLGLVRAVETTPDGSAWVGTRARARSDKRVRPGDIRHGSRAEWCRLRASFRPQRCHLGRHERHGAAVGRRSAYTDQDAPRHQVHQACLSILRFEGQSLDRRLLPGRLLLGQWQPHEGYRHDRRTVRFHNWYMSMRATGCGSGLRPQRSAKSKTTEPSGSTSASTGLQAS